MNNQSLNQADAAAAVDVAAAGAALEAAETTDAAAVDAVNMAAAATSLSRDLLFPSGKLVPP